MSSTEEEDSLIVEQILKAQSFYEVLGVDQKADEKVLKTAYKKRALKVHPDKNKSIQAEEAFKKVNQAFECLSDSEKRRLYDLGGMDAFQNGPEMRHRRGDFEAFFRNVYQQQQNHQQQAQFRRTTNVTASPVATCFSLCLMFCMIITVFLFTFLLSLVQSTRNTGHRN